MKNKFDNRYYVKYFFIKNKANQIKNKLNELLTINNLIAVIYNKLNKYHKIDEIKLGLEYLKINANEIENNKNIDSFVKKWKNDLGKSLIHIKHFNANEDGRYYDSMAILYRVEDYLIYNVFSNQSNDFGKFHYAEIVQLEKVNKEERLIACSATFATALNQVSSQLEREIKRKRFIYQPVLATNVYEIKHLIETSDA